MGTTVPSEEHEDGNGDSPEEEEGQEEEGQDGELEEEQERSWVEWETTVMGCEMTLWSTVYSAGLSRSRSVTGRGSPVPSSIVSSAAAVPAGTEAGDAEDAEAEAAESAAKAGAGQRRW